MIVFISLIFLVILILIAKNKKDNKIVSTIVGILIAITITIIIIGFIRFIGNEIRKNDEMRAVQMERYN